MTTRYMDTVSNDDAIRDNYYILAVAIVKEVSPEEARRMYYNFKPPFSPWQMYCEYQNGASVSQLAKKYEIQNVQVRRWLAHVEQFSAERKERFLWEQMRNVYRVNKRVNRSCPEGQMSIFDFDLKQDIKNPKASWRKKLEKG